jgi:hypothetical protein
MYEHYGLPGCDAEYFGRYVPSFQINPFFPLFFGDVFCPEEGRNLFFQNFNLWTKIHRITTQKYTVNSSLPELRDLSIQTHIQTDRQTKE